MVVHSHFWKTNEGGATGSATVESKQWIPSDVCSRWVPRDTKVLKAKNRTEEWHSGRVRRNGCMMYVSMEPSSAPQDQQVLVYLILHSTFAAAEHCSDECIERSPPVSHYVVRCIWRVENKCPSDITTLFMCDTPWAGPCRLRVDMGTSNCAPGVV